MAFSSLCRALWRMDDQKLNCCFECHRCDLILSFSLLSKYTQEVTKKKIRLNNSMFLVIYMKHIHSNGIYNLLYNYIKLQLIVCTWDLAWTFLLLVRFVDRSLVLNIWPVFPGTALVKFIISFLLIKIDQAHIESNNEILLYFHLVSNQKCVDRKIHYTITRSQRELICGKFCSRN